MSESQVCLQDYDEPLSVDNWMQWSTHAQELNGNIRRKADQLLKHDCIKYVGGDVVHDSKYTFIVLPLNTEDHWVVDVCGELRELSKKPFRVNYNSSVYRLWREGGIWCCDCQGHTMKVKKDGFCNDGVMCSHTLALYAAFKLQLFRRSF